jgi:hypothetical protein
MPQKVVAWLTNTLASMKAVDGVQEEEEQAPLELKTALGPVWASKCVPQSEIHATASDTAAKNTLLFTSLEVLVYALPFVERRLAHKNRILRLLWADFKCCSTTERAGPTTALRCAPIKISGPIEDQRGGGLRRIRRAGEAV